MYEHYWGLSSTPFADRLDGHEFYESSIHEEALARLYYAVEQSKPLAVLYGPAGCGKSQLLQVLARQIRRTQRFLVTGDLANMTDADFCRHLEGQLRLGGGDCDSPMSRWTRLWDFFGSTSEASLETVLLFDGLDRAEDSAVKAVGRLVRWSYQSAARLTVVAEFHRGACSPAVRQLLEEADIGIEVRPLDREETKSYVNTQLETAGREGKVFHEDAFDALQRLSGGVPREINRLCDLALLAGMSESLTAIDRDLIAGLAKENRLPVLAVAS